MAEDPELEETQLQQAGALVCPRGRSVTRRHDFTGQGDRDSAFTFNDCNAEPFDRPSAEKKRRLDREKKWNEYNHPEMAKKAVIEDEVTKGLGFYVMCKWCSTENDLSTWKKMRPWTPSHFEEHIRRYCKRRYGPLQRDDTRTTLSRFQAFPAQVD